MFVKPLVSEAEASQAFQKINKWPKRQTPEKIELVYFPYYLFKVSVTDDGKEKSLFFASDGIGEEFTFLEMKNLEFVNKTTAPHFDFVIKMAEAREKILDEYQGVLIKYRQYKKGHSKVKGITEAKEFYYPYWVGYYKEKGRLDCRKASYTFKAIDGISAKFIGLKMHRSFLQGFSKGLRG